MKITIDSLIKMLQHSTTVGRNTSVYFTMHDLIFEPTSELTDNVDDLVFEHIPSGAKIYVENCSFTDRYCADVYVILPGTTERIWIAEDVDGLFAQTISPVGDLCAFELLCYKCEII